VPQARLRWRTVGFGHPDAVALDVVAGVLNGRSGRLHRRLVLEGGTAFAAWAEHAPLPRGGSFELRAEAREAGGEASPEPLAAALLAEVEALRREPVGEGELARVKNQIVADSYRGLRDPLALALRLLAYAAAGDSRHVESWAERAAAVGAEDVRRVAVRYLGGEAQLSALYRRRGAARPAGRP
jgi:zinc protease